MNLQVVRGTVTGIAYQAGQEVMRYFNQPHELETKGSAFDFATEADVASERLISDALLAAFPDHHLVGEEGGGRGAPAESAEYFWFVDPIDGTSNFASGIPFFSISIALTDRAGDLLVGVVYNPVAQKVFSAERGQGATLNGQPLQVSGNTALDQAMLCSGFPYDRSNPRYNINRWMAFLPLARGLRRFGSAALELCWVAAGRLDGYWEGPLNYWDYYAGMLIVQEAGGKVSDYAGGKPQAEILASNGHLHDQMLQIIAAAGD
ncbi:MAG: inositol monophosphatase [Anaerolineae bacterium]|nr:inositol monophosphatase [Anaerolineae bacterium]